MELRSSVGRSSLLSRNQRGWRFATPWLLLESNPLSALPAEVHVGSNGPVSHPRVDNHLSGYFKRREWDSNPRGVATNALAGRRHKPLGHPSKGDPLIAHLQKVALLGIEPRLS